MGTQSPNEERESQGMHWQGNVEWNKDTDSWVWGLILIFVGAVFLIGNLTGYRLHNWWAVFILFPAVNNLSTALSKYRASGEFTSSVRNHAFWGAFFVLLSAAFLFGVAWSLLWPAFLILAGLGLLLGAL